MSERSKSHALLRGLLVFATLLAGFFCMQVFGEHQLPPGSKSFAAFANMDLEHQSKSTARINDVTQVLDYELTLYPNGDFSYTAIGSRLPAKMKQVILSIFLNTTTADSG